VKTTPVHPARLPGNPSGIETRVGPAVASDKSHARLPVFRDLPWARSRRSVAGPVSRARAAGQRRLMCGRRRKCLSPRVKSNVENCLSGSLNHLVGPQQPAITIHYRRARARPANRRLLTSPHRKCRRPVEADLRRTAERPPSPPSHPAAASLDPVHCAGRGCGQSQRWSRPPSARTVHSQIKLFCPPMSRADRWSAPPGGPTLGDSGLCCSLGGRREVSDQPPWSTASLGLPPATLRGSLPPPTCSAPPLSMAGRRHPQNLP